MSSESIDTSRISISYVSVTLVIIEMVSHDVVVSLVTLCSPAGSTSILLPSKDRSSLLGKRKISSRTVTPDENTVDQILFVSRVRPMAISIPFPTHSLVMFSF